jgi:hypothetical protein
LTSLRNLSRRPACFDGLSLNDYPEEVRKLEINGTTELGAEISARDGTLGPYWLLREDMTPIVPFSSAADEIPF